ncbi:molybdenum ABC transporter ATP-binding protein [Pseudoruegeria sp. SK021]|uniref:molybdenum ABC transporter ATP-binding protein n=1 Tax=Pseudoruegeria sp. SK021 TaxID=1933035 RepID=UPI000A23A1CB|nr:molybdenum ABC transporter ATP-binding protein [Pseudoruegeria sp. SK021]OSP56124.1 molybdenum ABC transporter ATP-binding protein [Pseudoruegeria sp. SK021]
MTLSVQLTHHFDDFTLDVAFDTASGVTALFGPSGSGKTTIVNAVAGLLRPDRGRVALNGVPLFDTDTGHWTPPHRRRIGYVFQDGRLFPHLTVRQNLRYGMWFAGSTRNRAGEKATLPAIADLLGLTTLMDRHPADLSGGEKQRVAVGRALLSRPQLLLMDEPLAALDQARKDDILPYLERLRDTTRIPILYVSHAPSEVARLATTVVSLDQGKLTGVGTAADLLPAQRPITILRGRICQQDADGMAKIETPIGTLWVSNLGLSVGDAVRVAIKADSIVIAHKRPDTTASLNTLAVVITDLDVASGPLATITLAAGAGTVVARMPQRAVKLLELSRQTACYAILADIRVAPAPPQHDADA